jgi:hypothetical protein
MKANKAGIDKCYAIKKIDRNSLASSLFCTICFGTLHGKCPYFVAGN